MSTPGEPSPAGEPRKPVESYGFLLYLGLVVGALGAFGLYTLSRRGPDVSDYARFSAIGAFIFGIVFCYLSSLPKDEARAWLRSGLTALAVAFVFRWAVGEPYRIPSSSMEPTLNGDERAFKGDRVWVNKWWYGLKWPFSNKRIFHWHQPQRWDIVVFNTVEKDAKHPVLVKRIVGLPGERINIRDGVLHVNGKIVDLAPGMPPVFYTSSDMRMRYGVRPDDEFAVVPPGHYLVCGDNSSHSRDGRYFGWLPDENIVGRVACIWWPIANRRDFTGFTQSWWWKTCMALLAVWTVVRLFVGRSFPAYAPDGKHIDHYWISFLAYGLRVPFWGRFLIRWQAPRAGETALYAASAPDLPPGLQLAGRIAALPGQPDPHTGAIVPEGSYFILSDDPGDTNPVDSRTHGPVPLHAILGKVTRRYWPRARATRL